MKLKLLLINCLLALALFNGCNTGKPENAFLLPVYGEKHLSNTDTIYHKIGPFRFTNQFNESVTEKTVENKIYVADFFFATCQSICPQMSTHLKLVQQAFEKDPELLILSHTVNPMHDTVEVLSSYGGRYGAIKNKWHFLTGNKKEIYDLAKNSYLVNALEDDGSAEGFLHSELLLLIDKKGRIRGMYDGTDEAAVKKLIADINLLKTEKETDSL